MRLGRGPTRYVMNANTTGNNIQAAMRHNTIPVGVLRGTSAGWNGELLPFHTNGSHE